MKPHLVFDIETIPSDSALSSWPAVEKMAAGKQMPAVKFASLSPLLCRVACASWMVAPKSLLSGDAQSICVADERKILMTIFDRIVLNKLPILTYNGKGFDVPVLATRARILGLTPPSALLSSLAAKPWENAGHTDLMLEMSFGRAVQPGSLRGAAIGLGLGDPKTDVDGSDVWTLWQAGELEKIGAYCRSDVEVTARCAEVWLG